MRRRDGEKEETKARQRKETFEKRNFNFIESERGGKREQERER